MRLCHGDEPRNCDMRDGVLCWDVGEYCPKAIEADSAPDIPESQAHPAEVWEPITLAELYEAAVQISEMIEPGELLRWLGISPE